MVHVNWHRPVRGDGRAHDWGARRVSGAGYASAKRGWRELKNTDKLYVPMDSLDQLSRYVGGQAPALKAGWAAATGQHQDQGARGARRSQASWSRCTPNGRPRACVLAGHAVAGRAEDAFGFTETMDQLTTIERSRRTWKSRSPWTG